MQGKRIEQIVEDSAGDPVWRAIGLLELNRHAEWAAEEFSQDADPTLHRVAELCSELLALELRL